MKLGNISLGNLGLIVHPHVCIVPESNINNVNMMDRSLVYFHYHVLPIVRLIVSTTALMQEATVDSDIRAATWQCRCVYSSSTDSTPSCSAGYSGITRRS